MWIRHERQIGSHYSTKQHADEGFNHAYFSGTACKMQLIFLGLLASQSMMSFRVLSTSSPIARTAGYSMANPKKIPATNPPMNTLPFFTHHILSHWDTCSNGPSKYMVAQSRRHAVEQHSALSVPLFREPYNPGVDAACQAPSCTICSLHSPLTKSIPRRRFTFSLVSFAQSRKTCT